MYTKIDISDKLTCVNLRDNSVNLMDIGNRRFMFHPEGWLILGAEDSITSCGAKLSKSHAEEFYEANVMAGLKLPVFDDFIRGWIGVGGAYKEGIIHFAPHIPSDNIEMFDKAFDFIETALVNGFGKDAVLRGFPGSWEQKIGDIIPEESLTKKLNDACLRSEETQMAQNRKCEVQRTAKYI